MFSRHIPRVGLALCGRTLASFSGVLAATWLLGMDVWPLDTCALAGLTGLRFGVINADPGVVDDAEGKDSDSDRDDGS